ncbi:hypothetical protein JCM31826_02690 [Thermaurantimonas aggregans]|uniref:Uncharacterized protein n=1 Tax=Thermaurantimonas aggregans TaxID=2173829 RepID=A0A401XID5_9FLAO|nr:hypothetical protein JCM31826_02690 [Thermaurantimonas aggregans]
MDSFQNLTYPLIKEYNSFQKKITLVKISEKLFVVNVNKKILGLPVFSVSKEFRSEADALEFFYRIANFKKKKNSSLNS